jgi:hypothetical protein
MRTLSTFLLLFTGTVFAFVIGIVTHPLIGLLMFGAIMGLAVGTGNNGETRR